MEITFEVGEYQWNSNGTHACGSNGIAMQYTEQTVVKFDTEEIYKRVLAIVRPTPEPVQEPVQEPLPADESSN